MPAFVSNGPEIPEHLLEAHEEGRVVFFCGAGISYPAGLPGFGGLVEKIYTEVGINKTDVEQTAFEKCRYDETLDLLERRLGSRSMVRKALAKCLEPKWRRRGAKDTHSALLKLSRCNNGATRLVTTNFDRVFERVKTVEKLKVPSLAAPYLPVPKQTRWDGIVYLHGHILKKPSERDLNRLVITSGDFGLAYLSERWASRFVSELLRNFTVCFVGYSIEDPVLRYMMDALSADALLGEDKIEAFAFGSYEEGGGEDAELQWKAKGVTPIMYEVPEKSNDHSALHDTLREWAKVYSTGAGGKKSIVTKHASSPPLNPSREDYVASRVLWALTDPEAAEHFADLDPVPPLEWLDVFAEDLFESKELSRFGIEESNPDKKDNRFSMVRRPAPWKLASPMQLVSFQNNETLLDDVMFHIARWLLRHLNNPKLLHWVAKNGGKLHHKFRYLVEYHIREIASMQAQGKDQELAEMKRISPESIPDNNMMSLWGFVLAGIVRQSADFMEVYDWLDRLSIFGLSPAMRVELKAMCMPGLIIEPSYAAETRSITGSEELSDEERKAMTSVKVVAVGESFQSSINSQSRGYGAWERDLHLAIEDFSQALQNTMDLVEEVYDEDYLRWHFSFEVPSISPSSQDSFRFEWRPLLVFVRDAWLSLLVKEPERAKNMAIEWWNNRHIIFKRLALYAAAHDDVINAEQSMGWLIEDEAKWLWAMETRREVMRLLVYVGGHSTDEDRELLEETIINAPEFQSESEDITQETLDYRRERAIWLRLAKLRQGGAEIGEEGARILSTLECAHENWVLHDNEREEFNTFSEAGDVEMDGIPTPRRPKALVDFLNDHPKYNSWKPDEWRERCKSRFLGPAVALYRVIVGMDNWLPERMSEALNSWSEAKWLKLSWYYGAEVIAGFTPAQRAEVRAALAYWLEKQGSSCVGNEQVFISLVTEILDGEWDQADLERGDPVFAAINHPIGHVVQGLLEWWLRQVREKEAKLEGDVSRLLKMLCKSEKPEHIHAKVIIGRYLSALHYVDRGWTNANLIPLFDWGASEDTAIATWSGYLWTPRVTPELVDDLKPHLLEVRNHLGESGDMATQFADLLTYLGLNRVGSITDEEFRHVYEQLSGEQLRVASRQLSNTIKGAGKKSEESWSQVIWPFIHDIWPKSEEKRTSMVAGHFAEICVMADNAFPEAVDKLTDWLKPIRWPDLLIKNIRERDLHRRYPKEMNKFLQMILEENPSYPPRELEDLYKEMAEK